MICHLLSLKLNNPISNVINQSIVFAKISVNVNKQFMWMKSLDSNLLFFFKKCIEISLTFYLVCFHLVLISNKIALPNLEMIY